MRRLLPLGLGGVVLGVMCALTGCGTDNKTELPKQTIELPKEAPLPAVGGGKGTPATPPPKERID